MERSVWLGLLVCMTAIAGGAASGQARLQVGTGDSAVEALKARIVSLRPAKVAWREIAWKTCLLDGLRESRAQKKPILLWIFIDRPTDDERC